MDIYIYMYICIYVYMNLYEFSFASLFVFYSELVCLSFSFCLFVCLLACLFVCLSVCLLNASSKKKRFFENKFGNSTLFLICLKNYDCFIQDSNFKKKHETYKF